MRVFVTAVTTAIVVATVAAVGLNAIQQTANTAFSTSGARLDQQEAVNNYGRPG